MFEPEEIRGYTTVLAAWIRAAGRDDPEALAQMVALVDGAQAQLADAARALHADAAPGHRAQARGYSWAQIAAALGVTRGAAWQRFADKAAQ